MEAILLFAGVVAWGAWRYWRARKTYPDRIAALRPVAKSHGLKIDVGNLEATMSGSVDGIETTVAYTKDQGVGNHILEATFPGAQIATITGMGLGERSLFKGNAGTGDEGFDKFHQVSADDALDAWSRLTGDVREAARHYRLRIESGRLRVSTRGWPTEPGVVDDLLKRSLGAAKALLEHGGSTARRLVNMAVNDPNVFVRAKATKLLFTELEGESEAYVDELVASGRPEVVVVAARHAEQLPREALLDLVSDGAVPWSWRREALVVLGERTIASDAEVIGPRLNGLFETLHGEALVLALRLMTRFGGVPSLDRMESRFWAVGPKPRKLLLAMAVDWHGAAGRAFADHAERVLEGGGLAVVEADGAGKLSQVQTEQTGQLAVEEHAAAS